MKLGVVITVMKYEPLKTKQWTRNWREITVYDYEKVLRFLNARYEQLRLSQIREIKRIHGGKWSQTEFGLMYLSTNKIG